MHSRNKSGQSHIGRHDQAQDCSADCSLLLSPGCTSFCSTQGLASAVRARSCTAPAPELLQCCLSCSAMEMDRGTGRALALPRS